MSFPEQVVICLSLTQLSDLNQLMEVACTLKMMIVISVVSGKMLALQQPESSLLKLYSPF